MYETALEQSPHQGAGIALTQIQLDGQFRDGDPGFRHDPLQDGELRGRHRDQVGSERGQQPMDGPGKSMELRSYVAHSRAS